ncbi:DUF3352 domain-containing protein [Nonomuraea antimicrobica]
MSDVCEQSPYGQDPERTTAYNWNQAQQPENQPTAQQYPGQPYPPQQPYQQQPQGQQQSAQGQGGYGQQASYGQQPSYGPQYGQHASYGAPQYGNQQPQHGQQPPQQQPQQQNWQQAQGGWQQQPQQPGWQQQQNPHPQGGWQHQGPEGFGPAEPAKKGRKNWIIVAAAALAVVLFGGGAVWAVGAFSGGGTQPNDVLPADSIAYVRLDLDPAANQKLALFQIARKFAATKDAFSGEDPRKALFDLVNEDSENKIDFAKDVDPWLGSRVGLAAVPSGKEEPDVAVAVQIKDQEAAKAGIAKIMDGDEYGIAFREDYALLTATQDLATKYAQAEGSLSDNAEFGDDMGAVGEQGVLSFWADTGGLLELAKQEIPAGQAAVLDKVKNTRFAGALRFDSAYAELAGVVRGVEGLTPRATCPRRTSAPCPPPRPAPCRSPAWTRSSPSSGPRSRSRPRRPAARRWRRCCSRPRRSSASTCPATWPPSSARTSPSPSTARVWAATRSRAVSASPPTRPRRRPSSTRCCRVCRRASPPRSSPRPPATASSRSRRRTSTPRSSQRRARSATRRRSRPPSRTRTRRTSRSSWTWTSWRAST